MSYDTGAERNINVDLLLQIYDMLKIPVEAIENFDDEQAMNVIANIPFAYLRLETYG